MSLELPSLGEEEEDVVMKLRMCRCALKKRGLVGTAQAPGENEKNDKKASLTAAEDTSSFIDDERLAFPDLRDELSRGPTTSPDVCEAT